MSQLALFTQAPQNAELQPDDRHDWTVKRGWGGGQTEWRCIVCGEFATVSAFTGKWIFLRPQLAKPPRGSWHYAERSHVCEERAWQ